jgi:hypothetical protein
MSNPAPWEPRVRRPVQRDISAAIDCIETLHRLGHGAGSTGSPDLATADRLHRAWCDPDVREGLNLLRKWEIGDFQNLALLSCPIPAADLLALLLVCTVRVSPRRLVLEGPTDHELKIMTRTVGRLVQRNLWISTDPLETFEALHPVALYAVAEHAATQVAVFGRNLMLDTPAFRRADALRRLIRPLCRANTWLYWIPAKLERK